MKFNSRGKLVSIKHSIKISIYLGIAAGIFGIVLLQGMIRENGIATILVLVSSILSFLGAYLAKKKSKSSAFVFIIASLILLCAKLSGYDNPVPPYFMGFACAFASINAFEILYFRGSTFDGSEEPEDIISKQDICRIYGISRSTTSYHATRFLPTTGIYSRPLPALHFTECGH